MAMFETLVQLFAAFAKIGFTSFGGTSMIPLIMDEMSSHGWMTDADLTNLIAIAEMTPGSLGVNAATFAGTKTAGMPGGVFAVLGVLSPTLTLTLLAAAFFQKFRTSKVMSYIMKIVKPVCIGMVLGVLVGLCRQTCITEAGGISLPGIAIGGAGAGVLRGVLTSQSRSARQGRVAAPSIRCALLASCWPLPQHLLPVSATGGGRRRCP